MGTWDQNKWRAVPVCSRLTVRNFTLLSVCCLMTEWLLWTNNHFPPFSLLTFMILWFLSSLFGHFFFFFGQWLLSICPADVLLTGHCYSQSLPLSCVVWECRGKNTANLSVTILDQATLLMEAMSTLALLAVSLLWILLGLLSAATSRKQNFEGDFVETWGTGFSLHLLPFVHFFPLSFVPGSRPRIHDIDTTTISACFGALTMCQVLC